MVDIDRIEKYILGGKWENQYPQVIEQLLDEVKRLHEVEKTLMKLVTPYVSTAKIEKALEMIK